LKLQITIDGKAYEVEVEVLDDEESEAPVNTPPRASLTPSQGSAPDSGEKVCLSPVMGLVIKVNAKPGQAVEAGELMMVLEAMKMETIITAPRAGTVKSVNVTEGDPVKVNQVLVEFE
jgi:methylmalonyl-CoA carboxyltransferase small subunit